MKKLFLLVMASLFLLVGFVSYGQADEFFGSKNESVFTGNGLPVGVLTGKTNGNFWSLDLGISGTKNRWKKERVSEGYSGAFNNVKSYYIQDSKNLVSFNLTIFSDSETKITTRERFLELVQTELTWYFREFPWNKQVLTSITEVKIGRIESLFISTNTELKDGRNIQLSFSLLIHQEKEIFIAFVSDQVNAKKRDHTKGILPEIIPKISFDINPEKVAGI